MDKKTFLTAWFFMTPLVSVIGVAIFAKIFKLDDSSIKKIGGVMMVIMGSTWFSIGLFVSLLFI